MDESRRQFEEWWDDYTGSRAGRCKSLRSGSGYRNLAANECYHSWQASRAAIEITPPEFIDSRSALDKGYTVDYSNGFGDAMDSYENNISAIGLKIKEN